MRIVTCRRREQLADRHLFRLVVLDDQQPLAARLGVFLDLRQRFRDALGRGRLVDKGERAARERMLAVLVQRDDLHRNVPGKRVVLELAQHGPAEHVGQEHVERHRGGLILLGKIECLGATRRNQNLESLVAREVNQLRFVLTPAGTVSWFGWPRTDLDQRRPLDLLHDPTEEPTLVLVAGAMRGQLAG